MVPPGFTPTNLRLVVIDLVQDTFTQLGKDKG